jgi:hypothetical protein
MGLEHIIRPFTDQNVSPTPFVKPGEASHPMIRIPIGFKGTIKTMSYSMSFTCTSSMFQRHTEKKPLSVKAQIALLDAAARGPGPPASD